MRTLITNLSFIAVMLFSINAIGQITDPNRATEVQEQKADKIVLQFNDVLSLTEKQELLFKKKQAEFIYANENVLTSDRSKKEINSMLLALYEEQNNEMKEILTQPQIDIYIEKRPIYDPLLVILEE